MNRDDERIRNYWMAKMVEAVTHEGPLIRMLKKDRKPPTRWDRFTWRVLHYRNRIRDSFLVLIGKKDACDPCEF